MRGGGAPGLLDIARGTIAGDSDVAAYRAYFDDDVERRRREYATVVNTYYDLVTDFYEYGWGPSFNFAPRARGESLRASIVRAEQWLALPLGLSPAAHVLDVGCGVGGPMRTLARFAGCRITGLNNNAYQVGRAELHNRRAGLDRLCTLVHGDFMAMPMADASFDAAYAIAATVHAPDLRGAYAEIARVVKPGAPVAWYEWCLTERYAAANPAHLRLKHDIELTNGIVSLPTAAAVRAAVADAGLDLVAIEDRCAGSEVPWWEPLAPASPFRLRRSSGLGMHVTTAAMHVMQALRIAPRGTVTVARLLERAGRSLVAAGQQGIFTPGMFVLARKG